MLKTAPFAWVQRYIKYAVCKEKFYEWGNPQFILISTIYFCEILEDKKVNITKSGYCENELIFITLEYKHLEYGAILRI